VPAVRIPMRQVVEALRLTYDQGRSQREIARALGVSQSTISEYRSRFAASGLPWPLPAELDEAALEARLYPPTPHALVPRPEPDWATVHRERKAPGMTLQQCWIEYKAKEPTGYGYTQFCARYHAWADTLEPVLRQVHVPGDKVFVDYAGQTMPVRDMAAGATRDAQIFVGALGASHLLFVMASWSQTLTDWIAAHVAMLEAFGGVPRAIVPDNLKAGVVRPCYYEPTIHPTYQDLASHYGTVILPARAKHPRDKAKAETAVQIVEREILAPLRHDVFTSLAELQQALAFGCARVNDRPFQKLAGSRRSVYEALERETLRPLPAERYELAEWRTAKANIDYHISVEGHLYSVPYRLVGETVTVRLTATLVDILHGGRRVGLHARSFLKGRMTTDPSHRPKAHQQHLDWSPSRLITWGRSIGAPTAAFIEAMLARWPHPEQGYRSCLGLLSLARRYPADRVNAACARAHAAGTLAYRSVKSILEQQLDRLPLEEPTATRPLPAHHEHVRGPAYYDTAVTSPEPMPESPLLLPRHLPLC
jgi:transposase